ncbi:hypothetical protein BJY52DRAFT_1420255 [Lactarius psammicola]|nr:hypothetical protein BJY52DRAFT_1420255 [Lactarius psammicola]
MRVHSIDLATFDRIFPPEHEGVCTQLGQAAALDSAPFSDTTKYNQLALALLRFYARYTTTACAHVRYESGDARRGTEFLDTVTIGTGLVIPGQSIGVASTSSGFGILGRDWTCRLDDRGTLSPDTNTTTLTVTDNLISRETITPDIVTVSFETTTTISGRNSELTFGGADSAKFTGTLTLVCCVQTNDTRADAFNCHKSATGTVLGGTTGSLRITSTQFNSLQSPFFTAGGRTFEPTANAQV